MGKEQAKTVIPTDEAPTEISFVERSISMVISVCLLISGMIHLASPFRFLHTVYSYQICSADVGRYVAIFVPIVQLHIALCLISGIWTSAALLLASVMFGVFLIVHISTIIRGLTVECGCFPGLVDKNVDLVSVFIVFSLFMGANYGLRLSAIRSRQSST